MFDWKRSLELIKRRDILILLSIYRNNQYGNRVKGYQILTNQKQVNISNTTTSKQQHTA